MGKGKKKKNTQLGLKAALAKKELFLEVDKDKLTNASFNEYYEKQEILERKEFEEFLNCLKTQLPISFRLTGSRLHALDLKEYMKSKIFSKIEKLEIDGQPVNKPIALDWYPNQLAWMIDIPRTVMRRSPLLKQFQNFLVSETQIGNISRQEAVSMIPPLVIDAKPGQYILDMCAAPGSKTAQLLESVMESDKFPDGLVVANDSDQKRAYMLVHQGKRLQTPCLMVTNHAAQEFPKIWMDHDPKNPYYLQFDRVLADVPCSGDGTLRKNKTIFATWNVNIGNSLHPLQLSILNRGCELLKVGGRLVYSTCSFNPIENEAVVAAMLNKGDGSLRLVDVSSELKGLERKSGLTKWVVRKNGKFYEEFEEGQELHQSMFPPKNADSLGLEKCLRVYPHLQNYGGFFVAVFEKTAAYGSVDRGRPPKNKKRAVQNEAEEIKPVAVTNSDDENPVDEKADDKPQKASGWSGGKELPFLFLEKGDALVSEMCKSYGLPESFPRDLFLVRSDDRDFRHVYLASEKIKAVLTASNSNSLKVVNTGVKLFTKANIGEFRVSAEAIQTITPYLSGSREISVSYQDLKVLITSQYPKFNEFSKQGQKMFEGLEVGNYLVKFDPSTEPSYDGSINTVVIIPCLRAHVSASLLLEVAEKKSLLSRLTGEELQGIASSGLEKDAPVDENENA